ncbi:MAG: hypothetical protein R3272_07715 [Candidatus Promineifilaceae bacterium]|nr:hypothetical protein [Candidatus Promineifilaceae bacterium]
MGHVTGVFTDARQAEKGVSALHAAGFGDDLQVIDRARLVDLYPHDLALDGTHGSPVGVVADETDATRNIEEMLTVKNIQRFLQDRDVDEEEALYYARRIQSGDTLVMIDAADEDRVLAILEAHGADLLDED